MFGNFEGKWTNLSHFFGITFTRSTRKQIHILMHHFVLNRTSRFHFLSTQIVEKLSHNSFKTFTRGCIFSHDSDLTTSVVRPWVSESVIKPHKSSLNHSLYHQERYNKGHEVSWSIMKRHEASWSVMKRHEASWSIMKRHEAS